MSINLTIALPTAYESKRNKIKPTTKYRACIPALKIIKSSIHKPANKHKLSMPNNIIKGKSSFILIYVVKG